MNVAFLYEGNKFYFLFYRFTQDNIFGQIHGNISIVDVRVWINKFFFLIQNDMDYFWSSAGACSSVRKWHKESQSWVNRDYLLFVVTLSRVPR